MRDVAVYTVDLPGHGRSMGPGYDSIDCYGEALVAFLDTVAVDQAIIVGHSMGGAIAQTLALRATDRVSALVLLGTGSRLRVAGAILDGILDRFEETVDLITQHAWSADADGAQKELGREALRKTGRKVLLGDLVACDRFDVMDCLAKIKVPALVVTGTADRLTPIKYARYLAEHIPDARLLLVEGAGHMVMLERPEQTASAIREFLVALS
jgi:pimeloyl-ACP methyl ester carboxylesterase